MRIIFVDTSAWVALVRKKDAKHSRAVRFWNEALRSRALILTSEFVIAETYTLLMSRKMPANLIEGLSKLLDECEGEQLLRVERASDSVFRRARSIFMKYLDQRVSYVDCVSYLLARERAADCIFAFDDHFRILGLDTRPY